MADQQPHTEADTTRPWQAWLTAVGSLLYFYFLYLVT